MTPTPTPALKLFGLHERRGVVLLLAVLLPSLWLQLRAPVPRLDADAVEYYAHLRSLYFDRDVSFANEFAHFGIDERWDKSNPTVTGYRRSNFSVGPALFWMPFYAAADTLARWRGGVEDGYSPLHIRSVCLASLFYAVLGLMLTFGWARELFDAKAAFWTALIVFYGTGIAWYAIYEATVSHALSFAVAAVCLRVWWDGRGSLPAVRAVLLGVAIGLAADVRWQNAVFLLLPAYTVLASVRRAPLAACRGAALVAAGFLLGILPQLLVFKAIFGAYLLAYPVQGTDYLRLSRPRLMETFFSSRHGLFFWTPVLWLSFLGIAALAWRRRGAYLPLLAALALMTWVNAASADWWAGGSFSNRRFDSVMPLLALGMAACLEQLMRYAAVHPARVVGCAAAFACAWNLLFMENYRRGAVPRDDTVSFAAVTRANASLFAAWFGAPVAWPANWLFAMRTGLPAASYDEMIGKYLFFRQESLGGVVDLGEGDPRADPALVGDGFQPPQRVDGVACRRVEGSARLFASLDLPEDLRVAIHAAGSGRLFLAANGNDAGSVPLGGAFQAQELALGAAALRPQLNEFTLRTSAGGSACVDKLVFTRVRR